jgi:excisionase family DNA binding protein
MAELMQVRQAARALGVSEKTVGRWVERGVLDAVRLPGSGVRRLRPDDVEALRRKMFGELPPLQAADDVVPVTRVRSID